MGPGNAGYGQLIVDGYADYMALFAADVTKRACLAHVRDKSFELYVANCSLVAEALHRILVLLDIAQATKRESVEVRLQQREAQSRPIPDVLHFWL